MAKVRKNVTMTERTVDLLREIRELEDATSDSEVIRKAVQFYRERLGTSPSPQGDKSDRTKSPEFVREAVEFYELLQRRSG